ncbi:hypothetical protein FHL06_02985 [Lactobacillus halodurans]|nr:SGNH/GDSL hydrolase family protein [Companilactobacillus halodurans]MQS75359.1 hypothetical protein [Companilactobacillus halodurans]
MGWSDWIDLNLDSNQFIKITIASPNKTIHSLGLTISNDLIKTKQTDPLEPKYFFGVSSIQVQTEKIYPKLAFFGDSLTNQGNFSAPLALELESNFNIMTANFGISGNRLLHPGHSTSKWSNSFGEAGFTRFDHMLDYQPNIIIFMEGINDFLHPGTGTPVNELPTANALSSAIIELKKRAKQHKTIFIPMTITPAEGNINGGVYAWSFEKEKLRLETNETLLKLPNVIDLANFVGKNGQLISTFDCGDHVHFSQAGGKIVADFIKEQLIRKKLI